MVTALQPPPRKFPTPGFVTLDATRRMKEEELPSYVSEGYYPVYMGDVFGLDAKVVTKLGLGVNSTV